MTFKNNKNRHMNNYRLFFLVLFIIAGSCKPKPIEPKDLTFDEILRKSQWRKTEKAIYNTNNELEKYLFNFDDAVDCEKNTYWLFQGSGRYYNFCTGDYWHYFQYSINNDSLNVNIDNVITIKHIDYYDEKAFVLDYDTTINNINKKIKETFTAFPNN